jgi:transcriptional regulator with XRE-family HTH domain
MMHPGARAQIRSARLSNGLSLRELGRRTGVTASLLSQIENGKSDPSVSTLSALVSELGLSLDALLRSEWAALDDAAGLDGAARLDGARLDGARGAEQRLERSVSPVIRPPERQTLGLDSGVVWERLTRGPSELLDVLLVTYEPGATSSSSGKLLRHSGIEYAYLMSGELTLQLSFETYTLRAGDSLEFDAATPHVYCNQGDVPARGLWSVLGRDNLPVRPPPHQVLDLIESGSPDLLSPVDFLQVFSRD